MSADFALEGTPLEYARVYIGPEQDGGHPGYRGPVILCAYGVWVGEFAEWLFIQDDPTRLPEWMPVEMRMLIPWHRIDSIEPDHEARPS